MKITIKKADILPGTLRTPAWALALGLVATLFAVVIARESQRTAIETAFLAEAGQLTARFTHDFQHDLEQLISFKTFLETTGEPDANHFNHLARHTLSVAPGLSQISWFPMVPENNTQLRDFHLSASAEDTPEVLTHTSPSLALIDQLLARGNTRTPLLRLRPRSEGETIESPLLFDIHLPLFIEHPKPHLAGILSGTIHGEQLLHYSTQQITHRGQGLQLSLLSIERPPQLLWSPPPPKLQSFNRTVSPPLLLDIRVLSFSRPIRLADQPFEILMTPVDYRLFLNQTPIILWIVLGLGLLGSIALFVLLLIHGVQSTARAAALQPASAHSTSNELPLGTADDRLQASEGLVAIDHSGIISFVNQNIASLLGYQPNEMIGQHINRFLSKQGQRQARHALIQHRHGEVEDIELEVFRKDGTWIVFSITLSPFFDDTGHYDGALVTLFDQTSKYRSNNNLLINEARFRAITEHGGDITLICDLDGRVSYVSPSIEEMLGRSVNSIMGHRLTDLLHTDDHTQIDAGLKEVIQTPNQRTTLADFRLLNASNQSIFFNGYAIGLLNAGQIEGVVVSAHNINDKKIQDLLNLSHNRTLELMSEDIPLDRAITEFMLCVENLSPGAKSALHLVDSKTQRITHTITPGLGTFFIQTMDGLEAAPGISPVSTTAFNKARLIFDDLSLQAFTPPVNAVIAALGLRACWSDPLFSARGDLIGVFSLYFSTTITPDEFQSNLLISASHLAAIAIERHLTEEALRDSEIKWRALITHLPDNVALLSLDGTILFANRVAQAYSLDEVVGTKLIDYVAPKHRKPFQETLDRTLATGKTQTYEIPLTTPNGVVWWSNRIGLMRRSGKVTGFIAIGSDVTERKKFELSLQILSSAVEQSGSAIIITDLKGQIEYINPRFTEITGYTMDEVKGKKTSIWRSDETAPTTHRELWKTITNGQTWYGEIRNRRKNGELFWALETISPVVNKEGTFTHFVAICEDLTRIKETQREMERLTYYDSLTGLENRRLFREHLELALNEQTDYPETMALIYLDLDQFKRINDTLGHDAGDQLLKTISNLLRSIVKADDLVARLGGDEFALLLKHIHGASDAGLVARRIIEALSYPITLLDQDVTVTASIGITLTPSDSTIPHVLMRNADLAMYRAKESGRNTYKFYTEEMNSEVMGRMALENELRIALDQEQFVLFFQPILDFNSSRMHGVEVLVRWLHPEKGIVPPEQFIPMLEESGMVITLGKWILEEACRCARTIETDYLNNLVFSVNLSARQFSDPNLSALVEGALAESGLSPCFLDLEITETMLMENLEDGILILNHLKSLGISLTIDDFGTGYSSLGYLKKLPINKVKVDKTFVSDIPDNVNDMEITAAVIAMAHKLNLQVTAEGIETGEQLLFLRQNKCDFGQGFLYSKPLDWDTFITQLDSIPAPSADTLITQPDSTPVPVSDTSRS